VQPSTGRGRRRALWGLAVLAVLIEAWSALYYLGRTWGATRDERRRTLPGDELVAHPSMVTDHAIDIQASPDRIWPWLVQMGWGRGGWYTHRWVDRLLFPANGPAAEVILPEHQQLAPGDRILDGPPSTDCYFTVERLDEARALVLRSRSHLPPQLRDRPGVALDFSWAFVLQPLGAGRTRFRFRSRSSLRPFWLLLAYQLVLVPADFVMARSMCRGLKARVERAARAEAAGVA
jgi:hypothetical protein